jgi:hypothetical protein
MSLDKYKVGLIGLLVPHTIQNKIAIISDAKVKPKPEIFSGI